MTYPMPRPFKQPTFTPLSPRILEEIDAQERAEIEQAWLEKQVDTSVLRCFPTIIIANKEAWEQLAELLEQPPLSAPALAAAFAKPRRFIRVDE